MIERTPTSSPVQPADPIPTLGGNRSADSQPWGPGANRSNSPKVGAGGPTTEATLRELREVQDWLVKPQLRTVPGVADVSGFGGFEKEYQVLVDPGKLVGYGLTLHEVFEALAANNANAGGAFIEHASQQYLVRGLGLVENKEDIESIVVRAEDGTPVRIGEVAEVVEGSALRQGAVTRNGEGEVVTGIVLMLQDANSRTVVDAVKAKLAAVQQTLPEGVRLVPFYDRADLVRQTIHTVRDNLFLGGALVIIVLLLLLGNVRAALITALTIPLSMLFAGIGMARFGISANLMSLGALDFGMVVDGSVMMVENCVRRLAERRKDAGRDLSREEVRATVRQAAREVGRPIVTAMAVIITVYLPIMTLEGIEGKTFRPMAYTVALALVGSLILSLTLVPVLASLFLRRDTVDRETSAPAAAAPLCRVLDWVLAHRGLTLGSVAGFVTLSLTLFPFLGSEFIPQLDEGAIAISVSRLPSVSLPESIQQGLQVEKVLKSFPEVETVVTKTGRAEIATDPMGVDISDLIITLKPRSQ